MIRKLPVPPFTRETAKQKVRVTENLWNNRDPQRLALANAKDSVWRNQAGIIAGQAAIAAYLKQEWAVELDCKLIKELWCFSDDRIAVRFAYEWRDDEDVWFRSYGNELLEFNEAGLMRRREANISDICISAFERQFLWLGTERPENYPGLSEFCL